MRRAYANLEFAQGYGAEVRNEDEIAERLDPRDRDRPNAFDDGALHLRVAVPLAFRTSVGAALEIVDVGDPGVIVPGEAGREALGIFHFAKLTLDPAKKGAVGKIRTVVIGFVAANPEIELDLDWIAADLEVFETRAEERDTGNVALIDGMLGGNLRDHAFGGEDIDNIEAFEHGSGERDPRFVIVAEDIFLVLDLRADDTGMARPERDDAFDAGGADFLGDVGFAAAVLEDNFSVMFDRLLDGMIELAAKDVGFGVVEVGPDGDGAWSST